MVDEVGAYPVPATRDVRQDIVGLENHIRTYLEETNTPQPDCPLTHHFAPGAYGREIFLPKDVLVVGKIHKHAHLNMIMKGKVTVGTEDGVMYLEAPAVFVSKPGTKRVVYTHLDTIWVTVHVTEKTDLADIEEDMIAKSFDEYDALQGINTAALHAAIAERKALCLG